MNLAATAWFLLTTITIGRAFDDASSSQNFRRSLDVKIDKNNPMNPGPCTKSSHGKIKLVKNRIDQDKLIMCTEESKNEFVWKTLDGSLTVGEYFDPAIDCSDVVDRVRDATDGFYWIKPKHSQEAAKVYCDVTTDEGGFMLVAKKNGPETWSVPSNNDTVSPDGAPHWSSNFGNMEMLDIRIKFSTTSHFKDTKADWSFRLNKKRRFGQLLVRDEGGCTKHNPGIGHIAYVKDLRTGKIVNTNFRCSLFSGHTSPKIGWGMMNQCLQRPCSPGFAFLPGISIRLDNYGSFSYTAYNGSTSSGIRHPSTAFTGCSSGKCCACYGPKGGTGNYCKSDCIAINGGTITKSIYTWIWIRSSLPRRVWKKCIEYTANDSNGRPEKYKINFDTGIPEKGDCSSPGEIKHNSAVLVAPDENAVKKVPPVPGLLLYSPSKKELFVQGKGKWNKIAMEEKTSLPCGTCVIF